MRELQSTQILLSKLLAQLGSATHVRSVTLALGEISELDQDLICQHWTRISEGTPAERAVLHFRLIKAELQCMACFSIYKPANRKIHCPNCGSYGAKVLSGEEFHLETFELDDE